MIAGEHSSTFSTHWKLRLFRTIAVIEYRKTPSTERICQLGIQFPIDLEKQCYIQTIINMLKTSIEKEK